MATSKDEKSPLLPIISALVVVSTVLAVGVVLWSDNDHDEAGEEAGPDPVAEPAPAEGADLPTGNLVSSSSGEPSIDGRGGEGVREPMESVSSPSGAETPAPADFSEYLDRPNLPVDGAVKEELRAIADSSASQEQKVAKFKSYFRSRNEAGAQMLAVRHLSKLVKDEQYNEFLADELMDPSHSDAVRAALVRDINGRTRQVMLPVMVEIAALPEHPLAQYAHQTLGRHLGDQYSSDPESLRRALNDYMRASADGL